ncbi:MAG: urea ABC transporter permease subunit UrtC [Oscillospiraceae bacterium]|nr:urea ABC transporter permease subunit UrtC [Oscillospiraceae bacterium]
MDIKNLTIKGHRLSGRNILASLIFIFLATAPIYMSSFRVNMLGKYMCFALIALGIDMIWGYTGILSLGHGVYFGLGAYCMAMHLKLEASGDGLPDFMAWSAVEKLPAFWAPFHSSVFTICAVILIPVIFAAVIGSLTFLNRIRGVFFCILSQALAYALATFMIGRQEYFGGSNGLTSFTTIFGFSVNSPVTKMVLFYITLALLIGAFVLCTKIINSRVGRVLVAVRDAENRLRFTGYSPAVYKVFVYCLSAALAGIAGALYVPQVGIISPTDINIAPSTEMVIWVAVGGKATLVGSILGALVVNFAKSLVSEQFPAVWQFFIGALFIAVILFFPGGLISVKDLPAKIMKIAGRKNDEKAQEPEKKSTEVKRPAVSKGGVHNG